MSQRPIVSHLPGAASTQHRSAARRAATAAVPGARRRPSRRLRRHSVGRPSITVHSGVLEAKPARFLALSDDGLRRHITEHRLTHRKHCKQSTGQAKGMRGSAHARCPVIARDARALLPDSTPPATTSVRSWHRLSRGAHPPRCRCRPGQRSRSCRPSRRAWRGGATSASLRSARPATRRCRHNAKITTAEGRAAQVQLGQTVSSVMYVT